MTSRDHRAGTDPGRGTISRLIARGSAGESRGMEDGGGEAGGPLEVAPGGPGGRVGRDDRQRPDHEAPEFRPRGRLGGGRRRRGRLVRARRARARLRPGGLVGRRRSIDPEGVQADARPVGRVLATGLRRGGRDQADRQERQRRPDDCLHQPPWSGRPHVVPIAGVFVDPRTLRDGWIADRTYNGRPSSARSEVLFCGHLQGGVPPPPAARDQAAPDMAGSRLWLVLE